MDEEQTRTSRAAKHLDFQAARFCSSRAEHVAHRVCNGIFVAVTRLEASEDKKLHTI
ncbi:MAG: hypothetical protein M3N48_12830 [Verrucomicrobiota bacterium]|nr:hypothetical protein [Verrucomicrobiota bacterium]